jgi:hypothetical protein
VSAVLAGHGQLKRRKICTCRESLKTLKGEGLVAHQPNVGYAVAQLRASELAEMYARAGISISV